MSRSREIVLAGILLAVSLLLPQIFHQFSMGGPAFLPMHIPVLIGGLVLSPSFALILGFLAPILSSLLTGMPPVYPMLPIMIFELGAYGLTASLCRQKFQLSYYPSLILAMLGGRIAAGCVVAVLALAFNFPNTPLAFVLGSISSGIPGLLIQLIFVPALAFAIEKNLKH